MSESIKQIDEAITKLKKEIIELRKEIKLLNQVNYEWSQK